MQPDEMRYFDPYAEIAHTENRLPHWQQPGATYFVTFRLADALPKALLDRWRDERAAWLEQHPEPWSAAVEREYHERFSGQMERWLDAGHGACVLRDPKCARVVAEALGHFENSRCIQLAWVVMPNHVHALFALLGPWTLDGVIGSWKRNSAWEINRRIQRLGTLWQRDYFDRLIRDSGHLRNCIRYIRRNPAKARLSPGEYLHWESELARSVD